MSTIPPGEVTALLESVRAGSEAARQQLVELIYGELHGLASGLMGREREWHSLQPTALLHEAFVRLFRADVLAKAPNRAYLFGAAARAMREILADHARRRATQRHGGNHQRLPLDDFLEHLEKQNRIDVLALHEGLERLAEQHERQSQVLTLRYFAGLKVAEVAECLGISVGTVESDFRFARAWLRKHWGEWS